MKIYTKTGDTGETGLYGGRRVAKDDARIEAYGTVDECNAAIGVALAHIDDPEIVACLARVQSDLLVVGSDLATPLDKGEVVPRVTAAMIERLEREIDAFEAELAPLRNFILPGGCLGGANLHLARAVARRAERRIVVLAHREAINTQGSVYMNRLSDHLFVLARVVNHRSGQAESVWTRSGLESE